MSGERWVVRQGAERGKGGYRKPWLSPTMRWQLFQQDGAWFYDAATARHCADNCGGRVVRLVSRAEAVERASRAAYLKALEDVDSLFAKYEGNPTYSYTRLVMDVAKLKEQKR